jgi:hypothetical protein
VRRSQRKEVGGYQARFNIIGNSSSESINQCAPDAAPHYSSNPRTRAAIRRRVDNGHYMQGMIVMTHKRKRRSVELFQTCGYTRSRFCDRKSRISNCSNVGMEYLGTRNYC